MKYSMHKILYNFILLFAITHAINAQKVEKVLFFEQGDKVAIYYDLIGVSTTNNFRVELYISETCDGNFRQILQGTKGHIGQNVTAGKGKFIEWYPDKSFTYTNCCFKVKAYYEASDPDLTAWQAAQRTNTCDGYKAYKAAYPSGKYISQANAEIARLCGNTNITGFSNYTETKSGVSFDMVAVKGSTFTMGSPNSEVDRSSDETQHQVTLSDYYMATTEVSQALWQSVMGSNPSNFKGNDLPVEQISWYDAIEFCNALSLKAGLQPYYSIDKNKKDPNNSNSSDNIKWTVSLNKEANGYRLPTESEWEYAARAGTSTPFAFGNNITTSQANYNGNYPYNGNAKGEYRGKTVAVKSFEPNAWGLYQMHGNVWEWCWDWKGTYPSELQTNPFGDISGSYRLLRGGSWGNDADYCRVADRGDDSPSFRGNRFGFRLSRNL